LNQSTVYVLDDELPLVELHCEVAELSGFRAVGFTRASEFFDQVTRFAPGSILLLDLLMPEMDGIEVMRRLAQIPNPPAIVLMSGHDIGILNSAEKLCRAHGFDVLASLSKPVPLHHLKALLLRYAPENRHLAASGPHIHAGSRLDLNDLIHAVENRQLVLHYQPQVCLLTGELTGVEALVRWQHPELGIINMEHFIPQAEDSGLIADITRWVIDAAVTQEQQWSRQQLNVKVSVNISAADITSLVLPEQLAELLEHNQLEPSRLTLEITESALMGELVTSLDILTRLRLKGFGLSIDDFGTGYSSLSQLHRVPFTELKIDRSFVANSIRDDEARAIVKTCIMLGHELNMKVVAEGVESEFHLEQLRLLGCDIAQGYAIARPMPADELLFWAQQKMRLPLKA